MASDSVVDLATEAITLALSIDRQHYNQEGCGDYEIDPAVADLIVRARELGLTVNGPYESFDIDAYMPKPK